MTYNVIKNMTDSSGPGSQREKCFSIGITDLSDLDGFDNTPKENTIYGLKFNSGFYRRAILPSSPDHKDINFEDVVNVNGAEVFVHYSLVKNKEGIWSLIESPKWIIDITITPTSVMSGKSNGLKKIMNNGSALISYVPSRKKGVVVTNKLNDGYYLIRNNETDLSIPVFLSMALEFPDEKFKISKVSSTTVIEVFLWEPPIDFIEILPGLSLKWTSQAALKLCGILLVNGVPQASLPGVEFQASDTINLKKILFSDKLYFRKLSYTDRTLSEDYLISIMP